MIENNHFEIRFESIGMIPIIEIKFFQNEFKPGKKFDENI